MRHLPLLLVLLVAGCPTEEEPPPPPEDPCTAAPTVEVSSDLVRLDWPGCATAEWTPELVGAGGPSLSFTYDDGVLTPFLTADGGDAWFEGLLLAGTVTVEGEAPARWWRQGYQSWSWSGVQESSPVTLDERGVPVVGGDGEDVTVETPGTSWWVGLVGRPGGVSLLTGALSARISKFFVAHDDGEHWMVWGTRGERVNVAIDTTMALDPVWIAPSTDADGVHREYAAAVADRAGLAPPPGPPPTGWATWYQFYDTITEDAVRANLVEAQALNQRDDIADLEVFQIDDGWQVRWGDWTAGDDFPSGMATLANDIRAAGFVPGLWMAPFYVNVETETYKQNPDWWVRDAAGDPILFVNSEMHTHAIIDATHPEAGPWMALQVADRVAEGYTYLKLDFLYAGAQEGQRYEDVAGVWAYFRAWQLLEDAIGQEDEDGEVWVLACGAPLLPTVGHADSYRTGADIAFHVLPDPDPGFLRWQARATAGRAWTGEAWWWVDPDNLILRAPLDDDWARGAVAAQAASGGPWLLGDDLPGLPSQRLDWALDLDAVATRGAAAVPLDPLAYPSGHDPGPPAESMMQDDQVPVRWRLGDDAHVLLNMGDGDVETPCPGGTELLTGASCDEGDPRTLASGVGEIWRTD